METGIQLQRGEIRALKPEFDFTKAGGSIFEETLKGRRQARQTVDEILGHSTLEVARKSLYYLVLCYLCCESANLFSFKDLFNSRYCLSIH